MKSVVTNGKPGTAMMKFSNTLNDEEIEAVVYFVSKAFLEKKLRNTKYHTIENGWENHERYSDAFPFVKGDLKLDTPWEALNASQKKGKQLYLKSCISCHDRASVNQEGAIWEGRPLSWPRNGVTPQNLEIIDAVSQASPYAKHKSIENVARTPTQQRGETLFIANCAFCHALDGSGKNWIGQFIEPHPRNFSKAPLSKDFTKDELADRIKMGVEGTAMPAWRYVLSETEVQDLVEYLWVRFN